MAPEVAVLRKFRDQYMVTNELGRRFISLYYQHSSAMDEYISDREWAKRIVRIALLPLVTSGDGCGGLQNRIFAWGWLPTGSKGNDFRTG